MAAEFEESVEERKARLRALRAAAELSIAAEEDGASNGAVDGNGHQQEAGEDTEMSEMRFRNYFPRDDDLQKAKHPPPVIPKFEDPVATDPLQVAGAEDPIVSIAPKKPNWDLRRNVAQKLEKLEKRTQKAIIELMMEEEKLRQAEAADDMET